MVEGSEKEWGVREIARACGMSSSSAHRILRLLNKDGLVEQNPESGLYRLGLEMHRLAWRTTSLYSIRTIAKPILERLVEEGNETAILGLYDPGRQKMMFALSVESSNPLRYVVETNRWVPIHAGATGLAIFAFLPEEEREEIIGRAATLERLTPHTLTDPENLVDELERVRRDGYSCTKGQRIEGAVGIATPIWGSQDRVVGDVAISLPIQRFVASREPELAQLVIRAAERVTHHIGGEAPNETSLSSTDSTNIKELLDVPTP